MTNFLFVLMWLSIVVMFFVGMDKAHERDMAAEICCEKTVGGHM